MDEMPDAASDPPELLYGWDLIVHDWWVIAIFLVVIAILAYPRKK